MSTWDQYNAPNLSLLFYKQIYKESFIKQKLEKVNGELIIKVTKDDKPNPFDGFYKDLYSKSLNTFTKVDNPAATTVFKLRTTYPGLLTGSGYAHDTGAMGDFKIGFFFDHTTGQPIIPGSSIKGVCRSIFEVDVDKNARNPKNFTGNKSVSSVRFIFNEILERYKTVPDFKQKAAIENILNELPENEPNSINMLKSLVKSIFGEDKKKGSDIFFDAVLDIRQNNSSPFLANDFITPHKHKSRRELDPFTNPNPIQFLKVRSEIPFEFRFVFTDTDEWTKEIKKIFFEQVLLTMGIGAKTNVGYGQFEEGFQDKLAIGKTVTVSANVKTGPSEFKGKIKEGVKIEAVVVDSTHKKVEATINGQKHQLEMSTRNCPENGSLVLVDIKTVNKKNEILLVGFIKPL